jgi:putative alpha-1,2-mannosidase
MEGNAWVYTYFVPHDLPGLARLLGTENLSRRLEQGFAEGYVDLSNQPNLQAPFLFNYLGKPWLTQKFSRLVAKDFYSTSPYFGWKGEEDEGQLSALYVLFAMGLFEMDGGCSVEPAYDISSPVFDSVILHLNPDYFSGRTFTIEAHNNSDRNIYIQKAELNGKPLQRPFLPWAAIRKGGTLRLMMGASPNTAWGLDSNSASIN